MKSQKYNQGELKQLVVNIDKSVVDIMNTMSHTSGMNIDELVVIALKRFISSHCDYLNNSPSQAGLEVKK